MDRKCLFQMIGDEIQLLLLTFCWENPWTVLHCSYCPRASRRLRLNTFDPSIQNGQDVDKSFVNDSQVVLRFEVKDSSTVSMNNREDTLTQDEDLRKPFSTIEDVTERVTDDLVQSCLFPICLPDASDHDPRII